MKTTYYQIIYTYKGDTEIFELWAITPSDAKGTFIAQCEHERMDMGELRIIKIMEIT